MPEQTCACQLGPDSWAQGSTYPEIGEQGKELNGQSRSTLDCRWMRVQRTGA
jgi:hypothetical protein